MKYLVTRTSTYGGYSEDPKVKGVQKEILPYTRISSEEISVDLVEAYTIEINSLEALHRFIEYYGPIIVSNPVKGGHGFQLPEIEVYDACRE
jgi:hypothetical protein